MFKPLKKTLFLMVSCLLPLWSFTVSSGGELNPGKYLRFVQKCIDNGLSDDSKIPSYLHSYILNLDDQDYIAHNYEPENISIKFRSQLKSEDYVLSFYFGLNKSDDCKIISVYEILN